MAVAMISSYTFAQKVIIEQKDVPVVVLNSFQRLYPSADVIVWEKNHKEFVANFTENGMQHAVHFDEKGTKHRTKLVIKEETLPQNVKDYASKNYPKEEFKEVEKITNRNNVTHYRVKIKDQDFYFDEQGNYIQDTEKIMDRERIAKDGTVKETKREKEEVRKNGKVVDKNKEVKKK